MTLSFTPHTLGWHTRVIHSFFLPVKNVTFAWLPATFIIVPTKKNAVLWELGEAWGSCKPSPVVFVLLLGVDALVFHFSFRDFIKAHQYFVERFWRHLTIGNYLAVLPQCSVWRITESDPHCTKLKPSVVYADGFWGIQESIHLLSPF